MDTAAPLKGIRVVELGSSVAVPYGTWILATLGATVVKVERPEIGDDARAYEAFDAIVGGRERIGGANQLYALQGVARIQTKRGQFEEALKTLDRANPDKLQGSWKKNILKSIEEVNEARHHAPK